MEEVDVIAYLASDIHRNLVGFLKSDIELPDAGTIDTYALATSIGDEYLAQLRSRFGLSEREAKLFALQHALVNMAEGDVNGMISTFFLMDFYRTHKMQDYPIVFQRNNAYYIALEHI